MQPEAGAPRTTEKSIGKGGQTPLMRQYHAAKSQHPEALLFFRMGDFYELFFEDAVTVSKQLDLTLTARQKGSPDEVPMAGVPHHAVSGYIQKLLDRNFKVAICDQMADPSTVKGIVPRAVTRVATPAIPYDDAAVDGRKNLYLACIDRVGSDFGVALFDAMTGELRVSSAGDEASAIDAIVRFSPREVLLDAQVNVRAEIESLLLGVSVTVADPPDAAPSLPSSLHKASRLWTPAALRATHRLFAYVRVADPRAPDPFVADGGARAVLEVDQTTREHLEILASPAGPEGTLLALLDDTRTHPGARLLRHWLTTPLCDVAGIAERHDAVGFLVDRESLRTVLRERLGEVGDLERLATKIASGRVSPRELGRVRRTLEELPALREALSAAAPKDVPKDANQKSPAALPALLAHEETLRLEDVRAILAKTLVDELPLRMGDGDVIREDHDPELAELAAMTRDGQSFMENTERTLQGETGISSLKLRYTRVFGWYLEVTKTHLDKVPKDWRRKQTIASGERYTSARLDELEARLTMAEEKKKRREEALFGALVLELAGHVDRLRAAAQTLARLDVVQSLAHVAHKRDYARPEVIDDPVLDVTAGRHPVVEARVPAGTFVANDVRLDARGGDAGARLLLVTGPNMSGKSTYMRQNAVICLLAQMGSFVPATHARVGLVDRILTRVGASDNLSRGESTFMVEMKETARILRDATARSFVILDEIGRGTSTYDGLSIAWAVAEYMHNTLGCRALFATHYHELTAVTEDCPSARNVSVSAREHKGSIVFLHAIEEGPASRSYGVACARLAGLPEGVLHRAEHVLAELEARRDAAHAHAAALAAEGAGGAPAPQLALFGDPAPPKRAAGKKAASAAPMGAASVPTPALTGVAAALNEVDPDALAPRDALALVYRLKALARGDAS